MQASSGKQELLWNACTAFVGNALTNQCDWGMKPKKSFLFMYYAAHNCGKMLFCLILLCRNNECPACRTHCASRRSLRDDPNFDALIAALYPDIDKYEEEVLNRQSYVLP